MGTFHSELTGIAKRVSAKIDGTVRGVIFGLGERIDERSPVGNPRLWASSAPPGYVGGHFRANNQYGFGSPPTGEIAGTDYQAAKAKAAVAIKAAPAAGVHYLANNTPYAMRLEVGHHSSQAPLGIYGLAAMDIQNILRGAK